MFGPSSTHPNKTAASVETSKKPLPSKSNRHKKEEPERIVKTTHKKEEDSAVIVESADAKSNTISEKFSIINETSTTNNDSKKMNRKRNFETEERK